MAFYYRVLLVERFVARVFGSGKVTIPARVRELLGVRDGDYIKLEVCEVIKKRDLEGGTSFHRSIHPPGPHRGGEVEDEQSPELHGAVLIPLGIKRCITDNLHLCYVRGNSFSTTRCGYELHLA